MNDECAALTHGCSWLQAMRLVDVMGEDHVVPDGATWMTLISGAKYLGRHDVVEMVSPCISKTFWQA